MLNKLITHPEEILTLLGGAILITAFLNPFQVSIEGILLGAGLLVLALVVVIIKCVIRRMKQINVENLV